jgi:hypothetical protein
VIGEAPGPSLNDELSLMKATRRIAAIVGYDAQELRARFEWVNVLDRWPGYGPNGGSKFPMREASERAASLAREVGDRRRIYLGKRVATAFRFDEDFFVWRDKQVVCPHPSGLNRWWNSVENVELARTFWQTLLKEGTA